MRDLRDLCEPIVRFQNQGAIWNSQMPDELRGRWVKHGIAVFKHLFAILTLQNISDAEKENRLRRYLALRWQLIQRSSVDYTLHSHFPANRACFLVAKTIAKPGESVAQLLMPTVTAVIGVADTTLSVKEASENSDGEFTLSHFLINTTADAIIALEEILLYTKEDTDRFFSDNPLFVLTANDQKNIYLVSPAIQSYLVALQKIHLVKNNEKLSVGYLLRQLQKALLKSSRSRSGTELQADFSECEAPILEMYYCWRQLQAHYRSIYRKISQYHAEKNAEILENYLLAMFSSVPGVELSEDEIQIALSLKKNIGFCCAEQIANALAAIIAHNPDLEIIPLPGCEDNFESIALPSAEELTTLQDAFVKELGHRQPMIGCDVELAQRMPFFEPFAANLCEEAFSVNNFLRSDSIIAREVMQLANIPRILWMLPQEGWPDFFSSFNRIITMQLMSVRDPVFLMVEWIQKIPPAHWNVFLKAMSSVGSLRTHFSVFTVTYFFEHCPEGHWKILHKAIMSTFPAIFTFSDALSIFFQTLKPSLHVESIAKLFSMEIKKCFEGARPEVLLVNLFSSYEKEQWYLLFAALKDIFSEKITSLKQVVFMMCRIENFSLRVQFLKYTLRYCTVLSVDAMSTFLLLQIVHEKEWPVVLELITAKRLGAFIIDDVSLSSFLMMFSNPSNRASCARALQVIIFLHKEINSTALFALLSQFPECTESLILLYRHQLVSVLDELLITFRSLTRHNEAIPSSMKREFSFLIENTLPYLVSCGYIFSAFPKIDSDAMTQVKRQLMVDFSAIDAALLKNKINSLNACQKKIELLAVFCKENPGDVVFPFGMDVKFFEQLLQQWYLLIPITQQLEPLVASSVRRARVWTPAVFSQLTGISHDIAVSQSEAAVGVRPRISAESLRDSADALLASMRSQTERMRQDQEIFAATGAFFVPRREAFQRTSTAALSESIVAPQQNYMPGGMPH